MPYEGHKKEEINFTDSDDDSVESNEELEHNAYDIGVKQALR